MVDDVSEAASERPLGEETHGDVVWVKARDTLLGAAPKGREMDDGNEVEAEAALVLTAPWEGDADELIVIEGSYRRLLKTLDYARAALLGTAPALIEINDIDSDEDDLGEVAGLQCPHCGHRTWDIAAGGKAGVTVVDAGDRYVDLWLRSNGARRELVGDFRPPLPIERDHYECNSCQRPVTLPVGIRVTGR